MGITRGLVVDAMAVELEGLVAGIDANRDRAMGSNSEGKGIFISRFYIDKAGICGADVGLLEFAGLVLGIIWVAIFSVDAMVVFDVLGRERRV